MDYRLELAELLSKQLVMDSVEVVSMVEEPADFRMGHFAYPCFRLAKIMRKAPPAIATELCENINENKPKWLDRAVAVGGYINFFLTKELFAQHILTNITENYGSSNIGIGQTVLVEYSSPNIAKHFHVGHLGTTAIGHALFNIYKYLGYETVGINYLGDWGTSFAKLLTAYLKWGDKAKIEETGLDGLTELYVRFHNESENNPKLEEEAREWVVKMENGDEESLEIWRWLCAISMREYEKVYTRLGITFDSYRGESYYNGKMDSVLDSLKEKGLLKESSGAMVVDLEEYKMPPALVLRGDGGTLYATRDMAAAIDRYDTYKFNKSLYVTANEQKLHFAQFFKVLELAGNAWATDMVHVPYGLFIFESGKMSTRKGQVIKLAELLDDAVRQILEIINEKNPDLENKEEVAEQIGVGAVVFNEMYNSRVKDVLFSWERMLNFEGETGPYVQYTHARACSLLEKGSTVAFADIDYSILADDAAFEVLRLLYAFPSKVQEAAEKYEPFIISRFLVALSQTFNKYYNSQQILTGDSSEKSRLALVSATRTTLENGLNLLGIAAPRKM